MIFRGPIWMPIRTSIGRSSLLLSSRKAWNKRNPTSSASSGSPMKQMAAPSPVSSTIRSRTATCAIASASCALKRRFMAICWATDCFEYSAMSRNTTVQSHVRLENSGLSISLCFFASGRALHGRTEVLQSKETIGFSHSLFKLHRVAARIIHLAPSLPVGCLPPALCWRPLASEHVAFRDDDEPAIGHVETLPVIF